jgi:hypothetical protein
MFQLANILNLVGRPRADEAGRRKACSAISRTPVTGEDNCAGRLRQLGERMRSTNRVGHREIS